MQGINGRDLDRHITGESQTRRAVIDHVCPECTTQYNAAMWYEMGAWSYEDDDAQCPECGAEGEME